MPDFQHSITCLQEVLRLVPQASPAARAAMLRLACAHLCLLAAQPQPLALPPCPPDGRNNHNGNRGGAHVLQ